MIATILGLNRSLHVRIYFPVFILLLHCTCICRQNKHYSDSGSDSDHRADLTVAVQRQHVSQDVRYGRRSPNTFKSSKLATDSSSLKS